MGLTVAHVGAKRVSGKACLKLTAAAIGGSGPGTPLTDAFAPAQFFDLSDEEKLLRPSFEQLVAGAQLTAAAPAPPAEAAWQTVTVNVQTWRLGADRKAKLDDRVLSAWEVELQAAGSPAAVFGARSRGAAAYEGVPIGLAVVAPTYAVADEHTLTPFGDRTFIASWAEADEQLRDLGRPGLQVVETDDVFASSTPTGGIR